MKTLMKAGLKCPDYHSPVDYMIEIACGDYGEKAINQLTFDSKDCFYQTNKTSDDGKPIRKSIYRSKNRFGPQFKLLFKRTQTILYRDLFLTELRIFMILFCAISLTLIYGNKGGKSSACLPKEMELWATPLRELSTKFENELFLINQNVCLIFLSLMIGLLTGLAPALLNFPLEMLVFNKEYHNGWYSCISYYLAKVISDLPLQVILNH
jgi:hypothetical protein